MFYVVCVNTLFLVPTQANTISAQLHQAQHISCSLVSSKSPKSSNFAQMHYKTLTLAHHSSIIFPKTPPPLSLPLSHFSLKSPPKSRFSTNPHRRIRHKLSCFRPNNELEPQQSQKGFEVVDVNEEEVEGEEEEIVGGVDEVGGLAERGLWDQIVEIVKFSGPATGLWICGPLMSLIDTAVIGQGSSIELAALGPGTVLCDYMSYTFMFLSIATSNMVATSIAQQDEDGVQRQISILLFVGLTCGVAMFLFTKFLGPWALSAFSGEKNAHLLPAANTYVQIRGLAWPALLVGWVAQSASLGMKDSWGPLKALVVASAVNGFGDIVLCMFLGYGIAGAAWATMVSQVIAAFMMIDALNKKGYNAFAIYPPTPAELVEIFMLAAPVFITIASKVVFYALLVYFATSLGTNTVAAHQVLTQTFSMCAVWGEPLSQTAQSFMPELIYGTKRNLVKARMLLKSLLIIGASLGLVLGTIGTCVPWLFPTIFTPDPAVIGEMRKVFIPYFIGLCITPCTHSCEGTLLAGRDLRFISLSMSGCLVWGTLLLMIASSQGLGLIGCWIALVGFQWARFSLAFRRILSPDGVLYSEDMERYRVTKLEAA